MRCSVNFNRVRNFFDFCFVLLYYAKTTYIDPQEANSFRLKTIHKYEGDENIFYTVAILVWMSLTSANNI